MKRLHYICAAVALTAPLLAGAAQWTIDSDAFDFPTGVRPFKQAVVSRATLTCKPGINKGIVTFQYSLPIGTKNAKLSIYSLSGARIESIDLSPTGTSVMWNISKRRIAAGVYLAAMRYGTFENKIQISIVK
ncbi:MAG TPA: hypothetical protein VKF42_00660 [Chitinivibrionales bacterium]|jgi:hypothetical protein|nr:hypothetical protein [Chitinivibrionales bacterium]